MTEGVVIAVITGLSAILGNLLITFKSNKDLSAELKRQSEISDTEIKGEIAVIKTELSNLTARVAEQNSIIEKVYRLEQITAIHEERLKRLERKE